MKNKRTQQQQIQIDKILDSKSNYCYQITKSILGVVVLELWQNNGSYKYAIGKTGKIVEKKASRKRSYLIPISADELRDLPKFLQKRKTFIA